MPNHTAINLRYERYFKGLGAAQRLDDEPLCVITDLQGPERCGGHFGFAADIDIGFVQDYDRRFDRSSISFFRYPLKSVSAVTGTLGFYVEFSLLKNHP